MLVPNFNHGFHEEQWDALVSSSPNVRLRLIIASLYFDAAMIRVSVKEDQLLAMPPAEGNFRCSFGVNFDTELPAKESPTVENGEREVQRTIVHVHVRLNPLSVA